MNILFLSLLDFDSLKEHGIYTDLLRKFHAEGHCVYAVSPMERRKRGNTCYLTPCERLGIVKLKIGNIQKTGAIEKGISTVLLEYQFISAIRRYFKNVSFDLVLYPTPPITLQRAIDYVKRRDGAITYLMLKDIFPQNAVDMGMLSLHGMRGLLYRHFRRKEKKLYGSSDHIGCMSPANVEYVKRHNPEIPAEKVGLCPNCIEPVFHDMGEDARTGIRRKLGMQDGRTLFVYGGNLGKPQGIPFLIECLKAMAQTSDAYFLIVGDGTEYGLMERFLKEYHPQNVKLLRALPKEEYENILLAADVGLVFLDHRFTIPNFPSRLLSYMQAGIPVLAVTDPNTDIGQVITSGYFGWSCTSGKAEDVAQIVRNICETQGLQEMGENARKYLKRHYTVDAAYGQIMKCGVTNKHESVLDQFCI